MAKVTTTRLKNSKPSRKTRETGALYSTLEKSDIEQLGTFADSKQAPIHRWFQYPAGFSYRAVEHTLDQFEIRPGQRVYDPFAGTGTTAVVCKGRCIESFGVEAHPFVHKIATVKVKWDYDFVELEKQAQELQFEIQYTPQHADAIEIGDVPELVRKCFSPRNLKNLIHIREEIAKTSEPYRAFFYVALTCALRQASAAATGWPYISPKSRIQERDGILAFHKQVALMLADLKKTPPDARKTAAHIILGDARATEMEQDQFDLSFTSPPYLNNYDYADRTRLETYFNGFASSWGDITEKIRSRLIMSATTQISRNRFEVDNIISDNLKTLAPALAAELQVKVNRLSKLRNEHTGKKSYDILVGQYFNDITQVLNDTYRVMKRGGNSIWIVGDSAPYGVFVPTDDYIAEIGLAAGFREAKVQQLRTRGDKWRGNTQRHHVPLSESIITLTK
ncbi:MAG: hypothetical protein IT331_15550 [Anaerolineae bacterium]|nr:hypothetical protein [Anaerolineae bacterium]